MDWGWQNYCYDHSLSAHRVPPISNFQLHSSVFTYKAYPNLKFKNWTKQTLNLSFHQQQETWLFLLSTTSRIKLIPVRYSFDTLNIATLCQTFITVYLVYCTIFL